MKLFVLKEQPAQNPIRWSDGSAIAWEMVANDIGVFATEDPARISELSLLIEKRMGGVAKIDEAKFEHLKKNPKFTPVIVSPRASNQHRLVSQTIDLANPVQLPAPSATEQAALKGDVVEVPKETAQPVKAVVQSQPKKPVAPRLTRRASVAPSKPVAVTAA